VSYATGCATQKAGKKASKTVCHLTEIAIGSIAGFFLGLVASGVIAQEQTPVLETVQDYLEFAEYSDGLISTDQLTSVDAGQVVFIDTRTATQYEAGHIPGAVQIEWRDTLVRRNEIPRDRAVVLYCETGALSSRAHMALRLAGYENVKVLVGGYQEWTARNAESAALSLPVEEPAASPPDLPNPATPEKTEQ